MCSTAWKFATTLATTLVYGIGPLYFEKQIVDHFAKEKKVAVPTWSQRYYVVETHAKAGGPVILVLGGEEELGPFDSIQISEDVTSWAKVNGGTIFALEHRFYSCHPYLQMRGVVTPPDFCQLPIADRTDSPPLASLETLTYQQAAADISVFVKFARLNYPNTRNAKFITTSRSYGGVLSTLARTMYPADIHAAVGSSAPVQGKLDFYEYLEVVGHAFTVSHEHVGGSQECHDIVADGHAEMKKLLQGTKEENEKLAEMLNLHKGALQDYITRETFGQFGVFQAPLQQNPARCDTPFLPTFCSYAAVCKFLTAPKHKSLSNMEKVRLLAITQRRGVTTAACSNTKSKNFDVADCIYRLERYSQYARKYGHLDEDFTDSTMFINDKHPVEFILEFLKETYPSLEGRYVYLEQLRLGNRSTTASKFGPLYYDTTAVFWPYQKCTQFGFMKTCRNGSKCPFIQHEKEPALSLVTTQNCARWGLSDEETIEKKVKETNKITGGWQPSPETSCVLYVNGEIDPWSALSLQVSGPLHGHLRKSLFVPGATHAQWSDYESRNASQALINARKTIHEWLTAAWKSECVVSKGEIAV